VQLQRGRPSLQVPPNGLVLYTGTILTEDGKEKKVNIDFEPFRAINTRCGVAAGVGCHAHTLGGAGQPRLLDQPWRCFLRRLHPMQLLQQRRELRHGWPSHAWPTHAAGHGPPVAPMPAAQQQGAAREHPHTTQQLTLAGACFDGLACSLYLCDNKFHTEALSELLESDNK
jgi:hypothetical protein